MSPDGMLGHVADPAVYEIRGPLDSSSFPQSKANGRPSGPSQPSLPCKQTGRGGAISGNYLTSSITTVTVFTLSAIDRDLVS